MYYIYSEKINIAAAIFDYFMIFFPGKERLVAGSVGPYGVFLHDGSEYSGSYVDSMTPKVSAFILFISLEINLCCLIISFSKSYIHN